MDISSKENAALGFIQDGFGGKEERSRLLQVGLRQEGDETMQEHT